MRLSAMGTLAGWALVAVAYGTSASTLSSGAALALAGTFTILLLAHALALSARVRTVSFATPETSGAGEGTFEATFDRQAFVRRFGISVATIGGLLWSVRNAKAGASYCTYYATGGSCAAFGFCLPCRTSAVNNTCTDYTSCNIKNCGTMSVSRQITNCGTCGYNHGAIHHGVTCS